MISHNKVIGYISEAHNHIDESQYDPEMGLVELVWAGKIRLVDSLSLALIELEAKMLSILG
tara:strand:- start:2048 stop:2230 length:183 start_codon:yes stop_codon:yes gene_type:complete